MKTLVVLLGPTGVGKTALSIDLARALRTEIVSADSRQIYRDLPIGTAAPTEIERGQVPHHLVATHHLEETYSASRFEQDALGIIERMHQSSDYALASGGSMMYIDALCRGIDEMPDVCPEARSAVWQRYEREGLQHILEELKELDPLYYDRVDRRNYKRVLHGYEMCLSTGQAFSSFLRQELRERPFGIIKIGLQREREELYDRINSRVEEMMHQGLLAEAERVYPFRRLNALNTVGYKELFAYMDGAISLDEAVRQIQRNTRIYARKQMTWWRRDTEIAWFHPDEIEAILAYIHKYSKA